MKWFYTLRNHVKGPFGNEEFEIALQSLGPDLKEALVWTRGKSEWTEAERWTIADAEKIEAQAHSAAVMQSINPQKSDFQKTTNASSDTQTRSAETQPATSAPTLKTQQNVQPPKAAASSAPKPGGPTKSTQPNPKAMPEPVVTKPKPNLEQSAPVQQPQPVDIIMPTDDEITKLLGASATELIESVKQSSDEKYKVQFNGVDQPPMNKEELIKFTALQDDPSLIMVFDKKLKEWKEIYTFPDVIEKLGLSRRQNRRVTLLANFKGKINGTTDINARLTTISMGGFGLTDVFELKIGDTVQGQISSPHFYAPLSISGEVTYAGSHGNIGLKFSTITDEGQALVIDYIKKFGQGVKTEPV